MEAFIHDGIEQEEEIAQLLREAVNGNYGIIPVGTGNQVDIDQLPRMPEQPEQFLSTKGLNKIVEHSAGDLTITVQAGALLSDIKNDLRQSQQLLPIDPLTADISTIGGLIATNASGPKRLLYGGIRDLLIGTRVVYADGTIARTGGKVVKNVAGYDMNKLFVGSYGTLGILTEATFKLRPYPLYQEVVIATGDLHGIGKLARCILDSECIPSTLQLVTPNAAQGLELSDTYTLMIGCDEVEEAARYQETRIREWCEEIRTVRISSVILSDEVVDAFWKSYRSYLTSSAVPEVRCKIGLPLSGVPVWTEQAVNMAHEKYLSLVLSISAGTGLGHAFVTPHAEWMQKMRQQAEGMGGYLIVERASLEFQHQVDRWGATRSDFRLMQGLKRTFDPNGILNRGRFIGGL